MKPAPFTLDEAQKAADEWGANCGPGAIAAVLEKKLDEVRPHLQDFEKKHYSNPKLVFAALKSMGVRWRILETKGPLVIAPGVLAVAPWPQLGLIRVQWEGPWTEPGKPWTARQRHTHWIGVRKNEAGEIEVFDINCICVGGWVSFSEWNDKVVPWLLKECEPKASGLWHRTHTLEVIP